MGVLMRRTNWAATTLGPVESWPQSLRTAVSILLDSRFGMYIAWGPQYAQLYNDGYRPILGATKHPEALGGLASVTFSESWAIIGPMFDEVRRGNAAGSDDWMLPLDRDGYLEECFFTFSYSPIRDESGGVGGVHVTVTETTQRVLGERRLRLLHALAEDAGGKRTGDDVVAAAIASLSRAPEDVPFALFYVPTGRENELRLAGSFGISVGSAGAPVTLSVAPDEAGTMAWPAASALTRAGVTVVEGLGARFGVISSSAWPEAVRTAVLVPMPRPGSAGPAALLVAGVSPRRALDNQYEDFFLRAASQIARALHEARLAEEERRLVDDERERLYAHFQQAPFAVAVLRGPHFIVELANPAALEVWGKTPALIGQRLLDGFPELAGQAFIEYLDSVVTTGLPYEGKGVLGRMPRGPAGDLTDVYFNFVYSPLRGRSGTVEGVLVAGFDVTTEILAARELAEAQQLFKSVVDNVPELAWTARSDGHIDYYNQRWYEYTGTTAEQMARLGWEAVHDPAMLDAVVAAWGHSLATGNPMEMEFPLRGEDGIFRWFLTRVRPLRDANGAVVRWFGTNTNIDERVRLLASEKSAREDAERSNRAKDEFLAIVSHELRNPLNAMLGWTRLLREGSLPEARQARALETIERNALNQAQLIEDLLDVSRLVSGKLRLDVETVQLARVVELAVDSARPALDAKGLRVSLVLEEQGALAGDPARLHQVVWNLLTNATKFTPSGGSIRVVLRRAGPQLELAVTDSGRGIEPSFLPLVFERFKQADASTTKSHGGLGLGLSITKSLVEMHGGTITAASDGLDQGATFIVRFPVTAAHQTSGSAAREARREHAGLSAMSFDPPAELRGLRVLVVDDEPDTRDMIAAVLAACRSHVFIAPSVEEAMAAFESRLPDVILSDIGMPDADGYELIRRVRARPRAAGGATPAACLTGYASSEDRRRALLAGFTMHLPKPIDPAELVAVVASLARMAAALGTLTCRTTR
ncbi:hypothetical protein BH11MYX4_BH11MYX4_20450 [soil metagenome]